MLANLSSELPACMMTLVTTNTRLCCLSHGSCFHHKQPTYPSTATFLFFHSQFASRELDTYYRGSNEVLSLLRTIPHRVADTNFEMEEYLRSLE